MSYSFRVQAISKAMAKLAVSAELDRVVTSQPSHRHDRLQAQAAADSFIDQLSDDDTRDVVVSMSGSIGGTWEGNDVTSVSTTNVSVNASLVTRAA